MERSFRKELNSVAVASGTEKVLSGDELGYLRALFAAGEPPKSNLTEVGLLSSDETLLDLLPGLSGLQVSAEQGDYRYVFPLESVQSPDLRLRIESPWIYDIRGATRSWRAPVEPDEIEVTDPGGLLKSAQVANLSASGLLLTADTGTSSLEKASDIHLLLKVPDRPAPMNVKGRVVRTSVDKVRGQHWLAIQFVAPSRELEEAICSYLLRAHCAQSKRSIP